MYTRLNSADKRKTAVPFVLKQALLLFLLFSLYNNCAALAQTDRILDGTIDNAPPASPENIHLYAYYGNELTEICSAPVDKQGKFKIELPPTLHQGLYELGFDSKRTASLVLSPEEKEVTIQTDYNQFMANDIVVIDSRENDACRVLLNEMNQFLSGMNRLTQMKGEISTVDPFFVRKTKALEDKVNLHIQEHNEQLILIKESYPYTFTSEVLISLYLWPQMTDHPAHKHNYDNKRAFMHDNFFEFVDFSDERIIYSPVLSEKYAIYLNDYTHHTPEGFKNSVDLILGKAKVNSVILDFTIRYLIDIFVGKGPEELVDYVVDSIDNYTQGCKVPLSEKTVESIESIKQLRVGQIAPEVVSRDPQGKLVALSSLIKQNSVVMLYFWESSCTVCRAENPNMVKIYNKFKDKGFDIYAVALDSDKTKWISAINNYKLTWKNVNDLESGESGAAKTYNIRVTPTTYLLNSEGRIISKDLIGNRLEMKLGEILH